MAFGNLSLSSINLKKRFCRVFSFLIRQQTYKAPEFLIKPSNRTVHEGEQFQIIAKVIGKKRSDLKNFE